MKRIVLLLGCLASLPSGAQAGELYRWVDSSGRVYYGDVPPAEATQVEVRKFPDGIMSSEYLPYETRRAQQNFPVTLYVADNCGETCNQARSLLAKRGIPFSEKLLKTNEEIDAFKQLSGSEIAPTLALGKTFLKGFQAEQWHSELDIAGYPKTAPYRAPNIQPVVPAAANPAAPENPAAP